MDYGLWTMDYGLWTMDYGLWTMDYGLWTMDYGGSAVFAPLVLVIKLCRKYEDMSQSSGTTTVLGVLSTTITWYQYFYR
jgi:hypothetical protein